MPEPDAFNPPVLVDTTGRPLRQAADRTCPRCSAPPDRRVLSSGFGSPHDVCGVCGHDFEERTL